MISTIDKFEIERYETFVLSQSLIKKESSIKKLHTCKKLFWLKTQENINFKSARR